MYKKEVCEIPPPPLCGPVEQPTEEVHGIAKWTAEDILTLMRLPLSESKKADLLRHLIVPKSGTPLPTNDT